MTTSGAALAEYGRVPFSEVDAGLFRVDEAKLLGAKPDPATPLRDETGAPTTLGAFEGKPLILVLSYFNCDGTCTVVNADLAAVLGKVERWGLGADYKVLSVSFNADEDTDSLNRFRKTLDLPPGAAEGGWRFALAGTSVDARKLADSVGFKYFWSSQDRAFLHPGLYVILSPQGRVVRFLYSTNTSPLDVELAVTDALGEQIRPAQIINFALSLCYSYSFKDGRYKLNIPMFVGFASLLIGIVLFIISAGVYRRRRHHHPGGGV